MRFSTSLCTSERWICTQSLTPASSTDWLPMGMPARVSWSTARETSGVISLGWLKWRFIQKGW